ncbi:suppressor of fused domain protein [Paenibacillus foliorum]|uniref:suppressor of fused domain protein n=1 Tax=Paenibacillus foliorum TaxID=2654974 RepID=UPI001FE4A088|nr:suppressor of fused domain protein [Paenibacillus foliorum]
MRVEIVGACKSEFEFFPNVLATCSFNVINTRLSCSPGVIFKDEVKMYYPDLEMKHVMFVAPFLWEDSLTTLDFPSKKVAWLLAIPISHKEYLFSNEQGSEKLETLFENSQINIFDLNRKSVL